MTRAAAALLVVVAATACERPTARAERAARAAADTVRGDSAALASLPPTLATAFGVQRVLTPDALRDTAAVQCERLGGPNDGQVRRRLRARLADSSRTVLFVRATRGDTLRRVELVRRVPDGAQRGFIWDATGDEVQSIEWRVGVAHPEVTTLPRSEPTPRALRALGRRLLALPCRGVVRAPIAPGGAAG